MRRFGTILAERGLVEQDSGRSVRVSLGVPRAGTGGAEWECPFRIRSAGVSDVEFGRGLDSMQALTTALDGIRLELERKFGALSWEGVFPHHSGFQRTLPLTLDPAFSRRLDRLIDRELASRLRKLKQSSRKRRTSTRPKP